MKNNRGSPPHTREECIRFNDIMLNTRITPAYAGRIWRRRWKNKGEWDHPRIRGKNFTLDFFFRYSEGSPPHTREESFRIVQHWLEPGITPAYAGRINTFKGCALIDRDHPRIRGKNLVSGIGGAIGTGSPPHTREEWLKQLERKLKDRITPAYAGRIFPVFYYFCI